MMDKKKNIKLVLEDGTTFSGKPFGARKTEDGEIVFNTGMIGYPECLTDPSYRGQILVLTYPLLGNYGIPFSIREDNLLKYFESDKIQVKGLVVANYTENYSHWNAEKSLSQWLEENNIPGISDIDTRRLTKILREKGTMLGQIIYDEDNQRTDLDYAPHHLVSEVSIGQPIIHKKDQGE